MTTKDSELRVTLMYAYDIVVYPRIKGRKENPIGEE